MTLDIYNLTDYYTYATTVIFWLLAVVWTRNDVFNLLLKTLLILLAIVGTVLTLHSFGFVVQR